MILTELSEEKLKEEEEKIKKEFRFIFSRLFNVFYYFLLFTLVLAYIFLLSEKNKIEKQYSYNQEILKMVHNEIDIYNNIITRYSSVDIIKKKIGTTELFLPREIWYIYDNGLIKLKGE
ncbi:MAG: hypothetical protein RMJ36_04375 [Candidatus Calescibacterium sp.]|nr:hypothetical protein [Candidatus Calescibacterium sp.]MDW8132871.1 hypothetical protein [Candidatus Calescibacterium sp.]